MLLSPLFLVFQNSSRMGLRFVDVSDHCRNETRAQSHAISHWLCCSSCRATSRQQLPATMCLSSVLYEYSGDRQVRRHRWLRRHHEIGSRYHCLSISPLLLAIVPISLLLPHFPCSISVFLPPIQIDTAIADIHPQSPYLPPLYQFPQTSGPWPIWRSTTMLRLRILRRLSN
jgi:hypothetical protein